MATPTTPVRLILASASPDRRALLTAAGYSFDVLPADVDEPETGYADPRAFVQAVSWLKASAVAPKIDAGLVIAADTVGWLDGGPLLKPADEADARRMLRAMSGREHDLWTGVVLWRRPDDMQVIWQEPTRVAFRALSNAELDQYLATRSWERHSGSYAIQGPDDPYVCVVRGSLSNVIGLPMETLTRALKWLGATTD